MFPLQHPTMLRVYVTGAAGFIGAHLCRALARSGCVVRGCDNFSGETPEALRRDRLQALLGDIELRIDELDINATDVLAQALLEHRAQVVVHLAARPGVRRSGQIPLAYARDNLLGFVSALEACRHAGVERVFYASSSSVYGERQGLFAEADVPCPPASVYAATKQAGETIANAFQRQLGLPCLGLRFFTVYGPWGRPDMAPYLFAEAMRRGQPITLFGEGEPRRDFTYIDDAVEAVCRLVQRHAQLPLGRDAEVVNIGQRHPTRVIDFLHTLERALGRRAEVRHAALPQGDVSHTCADERKLHAWVGPIPTTSLDEGVTQLVRWLQDWTPGKQASTASPLLQVARLR